MTRRRLAWLLLLAVGWPMPLAQAQNQGPGDVSAEKRQRSHMTVGGMDRAAAEKFFKQRFGRHHDQSQVNNLVQKLLDDSKNSHLFNEDLRALFESLRANADQGVIAIDDETLQLFQEWVKKQRDLGDGPAKVDPQQLDSLERVIKERTRPGPAGGLTDPSRPETVPPSPGSSAPEGQTTPPGAGSPTGEPEQEVRFREGLLRYAERYLGKTGRGSSALQRAHEELSRQRSGRLEEWLPAGVSKEGLRARLPQLNHSLRLDRAVKDADWLFRMRPSPPRIGDGRSSPPPSPGGLPAVTTPDDASGWQVLLWLGLGAVLVVVFWKVLADARNRAATRAAGGFRLGRWPVHPAVVTTREELVRAFEYLSLLLLGPAARSWNHLEIAGRLGGGSAGADRPRAAARLAGFYERARYAPPEEPLPDAELAEARRHLCYLAGVSAS